MSNFLGILLDILGIVLPSFFQKLYEQFNKKYTVSTVYPNGKSNRAFIKDLRKARVIKRIALGGTAFFVEHTNTLRKLLKYGCEFRFLVCGNSNYLTQNDAVVGNPDTKASIKTTGMFESELQWLLQLTPDEYKQSKIEVRYYSLEFRNPVTIIIDNNGNKYGYLSLSLIPEPHANSPFVKFKKNRCDLAEAHFDKIWDLHKNDNVNPFSPSQP